MTLDVCAALASGRVITVDELNSYSDLRTTSLGGGVFVYSGVCNGQLVTVIQAPAAMVIAARQA